MSAHRSPSHQTLKLEAGRHHRPEDGACVMELASMLAGEPFGDHPASVCPVIAAFLRSYNDHIDDGRRQELYRYAAHSVGTRADAGTEQVRAEMCLRWARESCDPPPVRVRILHRLFRCQGPDVHGVLAARAAVASDNKDVVHRSALRFLDELIAVGCDRRRGGDGGQAPGLKASATKGVGRDVLVKRS
jgi:hypothetical protein